MKDENEKVYFHLKRNFKWKDFKFHYEIFLEEDLDAITFCLVLFMWSIILVQMMTGAATTAAKTVREVCLKTSRNISGVCFN